MEHGTTQKEEENPDPQIHEISADDQDGDSITPRTGINPGPDRDSSGEVEEEDYVIDVKPRRPGGESSSEEKICRICHMGPEGSSSSPSSSSSSSLMELGCGCKDELGTCHRHCAEKWFRHRGNRECEICGKTANNIADLTQERGIFAMEWHEMRLLMAASRNSENRQHSSSCHCTQYCCKFLLACFLLALVLPWFFRVDMI